MTSPILHTEQDRKALHDSRFYSKGTPVVPPLMLDILTRYSNIAENEILEHVSSLRDRAWSIYHYPCIGRYRFLSFNLVDHPLYSTYILPKLLAPSVTASTSTALSSTTAPSKLSSAPKKLDPSDISHSTSLDVEPAFLDIGTCLGQDLRVLLHAGVPASRIFATDIEPGFIALGYELFRDQPKFPASHQIAPIDVFDSSNFEREGRLDRFLYGVDILHISAVFHLFCYADQVTIGKRVLQLMRRRQQQQQQQQQQPQPQLQSGQGKGSVIFGSQTANVQPTVYDQRVGGRGDNLFRHNVESWERMWKEDITSHGDLEDGNGVCKYRLRMVTSLSEIDKRVHINGLQGDTNDKGGPAADPGFRWMKFEVWVEAFV